MAFVRRITVLGDDGPVTVFKKKSKKRKVSRWLKPAEKRQRRLFEAGEAVFGELVDQQRRSNRKRRNGFLRDAPKMAIKASRKGWKKLRKGL